jgi:molecular chaperone DnaK (HSP70)
MTKVLGIDLGTTNSVAAVMEAGEPTVLENAEGSAVEGQQLAYDDLSHALYLDATC